MKNSTAIIDKYTKSINKRCIYRDIKYDDRGINYKPFVKFRYCIFNSKETGEGRHKQTTIYKIGNAAWRLLCYLIINSQNQEFIKTTPTIIMEDLHMTKYEVFKSLHLLQNNELIYSPYLINNKNKDVHRYLQIAINYTNDDNYSNDKGYKAIPMDFIRRSIYDMNSDQWTIFSYLVILHRYCKIDKSIDEDTGEVHYYCNEYGYAFPSQDYMSALLKIDKHNLIEDLNQLDSKRYISIVRTTDKWSIVKEKGSKAKIKNINNKYYVTLLNRKEYMKYHILDIPYPNTYTEKQIKIMDKHDIDYLLEHHPELINDKKFVYEHYSIECGFYESNYNQNEKQE